MSAMKVSLDNGETWQEMKNLLIINDSINVPGEDNSKGELHVKVTPEGITMDVWCSRESYLDHNIATSSECFEELISRIIEESS